MDTGARVVFSCSTRVQDELFNENFSDCMCMFDLAITVCLYLSMKKTASCVKHSSQYLYKLTACTFCTTY